MKLEDILKKPVVYQLPGMEQAEVRKDIQYKTIGTIELTLDVYYPADYQEESPLPAVIFVHGDAPWEVLETIKTAGQYRSWGQLAAASGFIGITFTHRSTGGFQDLVGPTEDILDLFAFVQEHADELSIAADRMVAWVCSAGGPTGLTALLQHKPSWLKGIVSYYAMMDLEALKAHLPDAPAEWFASFSASTYLSTDPAKVPPLLVVKALLDRPVFNDSIDRFVEQAEQAAIPLQLLAHPEGGHSFDVLDDTETSRAIIQETLAFMKKRLLSES